MYGIASLSAATTRLTSGLFSPALRAFWNEGAILGSP